MSTNKNDTKSTGDADFCAESRTMSGQGVTPNERATVEALAEAWNRFMRLDGRDYEMERDFRQSINRAQDIIAYRVASRIDPDLWKQLPPAPPALRGRPGVIDLLRKVTGDPVAEPTPPAPVEVVSATVTIHVEAMESGKTIIGGRRAGKTEAMRMMMARDATPPAHVEEWEPLAVIRRLSDLYRSNKSDTEVSARAMAMIQEFGARLSRSKPPAERPTPETDEVFGPELFGIRARTCRRLERQLAEAREQRDRLAEALRSTRQMTRNDERCSVCTEVYHASNAALTAVKETTNA